MITAADGFVWIFWVIPVRPCCAFRCWVFRHLHAQKWGNKCGKRDRAKRVILFSAMSCVCLNHRSAVVKSEPDQSIDTKSLTLMGPLGPSVCSSSFESSLQVFSLKIDLSNLHTPWFVIDQFIAQILMAFMAFMVQEKTWSKYTDPANKRIWLWNSDSTLQGGHRAS